MNARSTVLVGLLALSVAAPALLAQTVPGYTVSGYATVNTADELTFAPDGTLFVGTQNTSGSTRISRVPAGGGAGVAYGPTFVDGNSVLYDGAGAISGTPGSVLVGGQRVIGGPGGIFAVLPDESMVDLGTLNISYNPNSMAFDSSGNVLLAHDTTSPAIFSQIGVWDGVAESVLTNLPANNSTVWCDTTNGRVYIGATDGIVHVYDDTTGADLAPGGLLTGLTTVWTSPLTLGPGGALWGNDLYVVDRGPGNLLRVDPFSGASSVIGTGFGNITDDIVSDVAFGPDGAMYVSFFHRGEVLRIIPEPTSLALLGLAALGLIRRR